MFFQQFIRFLWAYGAFGEQRFVDGDGGGVPPRHLHLPRELRPTVALRLVLEQGVQPLATVVVEPAHQHEAVLVADAVGAVQSEGQIISYIILFVNLGNSKLQYVL